MDNGSFFIVFFSSYPARNPGKWTVSWCEPAFGCTEMTHTLTGVIDKYTETRKYPIIESKFFISK